MLTHLAEEEQNNIRSRKLSIDAMVVEPARGEVADRQGCIKASLYHEVVVYEDRGEDLSFLKTPKHDTITATDTPTSDGYLSTDTSSQQSGSERLQLQEAANKHQKNLQRTGSPKDIANSKAKWKAFAHSMVNVFGIKSTTDKQAAAAEEFYRKPRKEPKQPQDDRTRADKGQVNPPIFTPGSQTLDHLINAFLEFKAIIVATREVNLIVCKNIMHSFRLDNKNLLQVRIKEAEAAVYQNDTSQILTGTMSGRYMTAYSATGGFVALDEEATKRTGKLQYATPTNDPIVIVARCTRIMLDDRILQMMETITDQPLSKAAWESWTVPEFNWINGVPGCGKTVSAVCDFNEYNDMLITTTVEAAIDLRSKVAGRVGNSARSKVRTMASILANGFKEIERCNRLIIDEALMNHFGSIVMVARLSKASKVILIGDTNQLPYFDRENLFKLKYSSPFSVLNINKELLCTHRNPMDIAYALSDVYKGMYSSTSRVRSLKLESYIEAQIPMHLANTLFLVHTQEEKLTLTNKGYGSGSGSRLLTIHEAQGLTFTSVIILQTKTNKLRLHDSVPHAVVAVSRHTQSCVYYTVNSDDAISRFIRRAIGASTKKIKDHNLKMAMLNRDSKVIEAMLSNIGADSD